MREVEVAGLTERLLRQWREGDEGGRDAVAAHLYDETRRVAARLMAGERATPTFDATDLAG